MNRTSGRRGLQAWTLALLAAASLLAACTGATASHRAPAVAPAAAADAASAVETQATQAAITPQAAVDRLREGNVRFVDGASRRRDLRAQQQATSAGQFPFAAVLSCMDSRVPPETVFDQGIGDIFTLRVAGNVANPDIIGSLEYATEVTGIRAIVVLGHTLCGAVKGACDRVELGQLTGLLRRIQPAVDEAQGVPGTHDSKNHAYVDTVTEANVRHTMRELTAGSPLIAARVARGDLLIRGAIYDLETGRVRFLGAQ